MNITCTIRDLRRALAFVSQGIVGKSAILDTLLRVLLIAGEDGRLQLAVGCAELHSTYSIDAMVKEPGRVYIPLQALSACVGRGKDPAEVEARVSALEETCALSSEQPSSLEDTLTLLFVHGQQRATITGSLAPCGPIDERPAEGVAFAMPARLLSEMIAQVVFAASADEHVPVGDRVFLNVWVHIPGNETLTLAACDHSQLALRTVRLSGAVIPYGTLQIPAGAFVTLVALLAGKEHASQVQIVAEVKQRQLRFLLPNGEVALHLAETDLLLERYHTSFAPFEKLIPSVLPARCTTRVIVPTGRLKAALKPATGLVHCTQRTGEGGQEQLSLEIFRKGSERMTTACVPVVKWKGVRVESCWFDAGYLKQALSCPGMAALVALELGKTPTSPIVVRWVDGKTSNKDYAYVFAVLDPYLALLSTKALHVLSPPAQQLANALPERLAERGEWVERRRLRDLVLREIIRILDTGHPPSQDDVKRIAASAHTKKLLAQEQLEKLSFGKKREHKQRLAAVSERIAILAFAEGGYEVPGYGMCIEAAGIRGAFLAMKEIGDA